MGSGQGVQGVVGEREAFDDVLRLGLRRIGESERGEVMGGDVVQRGIVTVGALHVSLFVEEGEAFHGFALSYSTPYAAGGEVCDPLVELLREVSLPGVGLVVDAVEGVLHEVHEEVGVASGGRRVGREVGIDIGDYVALGGVAPGCGGAFEGAGDDIVAGQQGEDVLAGCRGMGLGEGAVGVAEALAKGFAIVCGCLEGGDGGQGVGFAEEVGFGTGCLDALCAWRGAEGL